MYGQFPLTVDISESVVEIGRILTMVKGRNVDEEEVLQICSHYKQLSLVCACAFMMSPYSGTLRGRPKQAVIRNQLMEEIKKVFPIFATPEENDRLGYQVIMAVVTELTYSMLMDITSLVPNIHNAMGQPHLATMFPADCSEIAGKRHITFKLLVTLPPNQRRLLA